MKVGKYEVPEGLLYTKEHEWARLTPDGSVVVGITDYAADQLHDIVFVELPQVGSDQSQGKRACSVESVKSTADVTSPFSGVVTKANSELAMHPEKVNQSPYGDGWFFELRPSAQEPERRNLMDAAGYAALLAQLVGQS